MKRKIFNISLCLTIIFTYLVAPIMASAAAKYYGKVVASDGLNIRKGPSTSSSLVGTALYGTELELVSGNPVSTK